MSQPNQPKIVQKLLIRTAGLLFILAILFVSIRYVIDNQQDFDPGTAATAGWISALEEGPSGTRAIVFKPDGTVLESPSYREGADDKDLTWRPDGNRLFFISDREDNNFHIFRWNLSTNMVTRRTVDKRSYSALSFDSHTTDPDAEAILTSRGWVFAFDAKAGSTARLLPPQAKNTPQMDGNDSNTGSAGAGLGNSYTQFGDSIRLAKWALDRQMIIAIVKSEAGEVLVKQDLRPDGNNRLPSPVPLAAAEHIEFEVSNDGTTLVFDSLHLKPLEEIIATTTGVPPEKKPERSPFKNALQFVKLDDIKPAGLITGSPDDKVAFGNIAISPDSSQIAVVFGTGDSSGSVSSHGIALLPIEDAGGNKRMIVAEGQVYQPNFHPGGQKLVFLRAKSGKTEIVTIDIDNPSGTQKVLGREGKSYRLPKYSPQPQ